MNGAGTTWLDTAMSPPLKRQVQRMASAIPSRVFGVGLAPDQLEREVM